MATNETKRLADELRNVYRGDPWYGPSVHAALEGVDFRMATTRPLPNAHTIAELVVHMTGWTREVRRRLQTGLAQDPENGDWPTAVPSSQAEWRAILKAFDAANADLVAAIQTQDPSRLPERIGHARNRALGSGVSRYANLRGLVEHHIYHAGQISLLKRALAGG